MVWGTVAHTPQWQLMGSQHAKVNYTPILFSKSITEYHTSALSGRKTQGGGGPCWHIGIILQYAKVGNLSASTIFGD